MDQFKDSFRPDESERVVCIGERALMTETLSESVSLPSWCVVVPPAGPAWANGPLMACAGPSASNLIVRGSGSPAQAALHYVE
jgi:hypothetical protein